MGKVLLYTSLPVEEVTQCTLLTMNCLLDMGEQDEEKGGLWACFLKMYFGHALQNFEKHSFQKQNVACFCPRICVEKEELTLQSGMIMF